MKLSLQNDERLLKTLLRFVDCLFVEHVLGSGAELRSAARLVEKTDWLHHINLPPRPLFVPLLLV